MKDILIINTGGTFNKIYNALTGKLEVSGDSIALLKILQNFQNLSYEVKSIIHKDSLDIQNTDRKELTELIKSFPQNKILVVHGTDTMDKTALYIAKFIQTKSIVFTGAMVPFSINETEANSNFSMALGFLLAEPKNEVYIAMHGLVKRHDKVFKNRKIGVFEHTS